MAGRNRFYYINLGGTVANVGAIRWGFRAPKDTYKNIAADLGVVEVKDNKIQGVVFGTNKPKPARVRLSYTDAQAGGGEGNDLIKSVVRYCEYDKLNAVLFGSINGKKVVVKGNSYDINDTTLVGG